MVRAMAKFNVENPTGKSKAVREAGGLTIIKPGKKASVEADWSDAEVARYEAAGLKIAKATGQAKAEPKPADDK